MIEDRGKKQKWRYRDTKCLRYDQTRKIGRPNNWKVLWARKPKGLNVIAKIQYKYSNQSRKRPHRWYSGQRSCHGCGRSWFKPGRVKQRLWNWYLLLLRSTKSIKEWEWTNVWLGICIMCPSGITCLFANCYFRELVL
jgi:hypothetical protein